MGSRENEAEEFIKAFKEHLYKIDEHSNVILRAHLEIEFLLDEVIELIFFRPEYIKKLRLEFRQKLEIAKAYSPDPIARDWKIIECLNEARNSIAHRASREQRAGKIKKIRDTITGLGTKEFQAEVKNADDREIVVLAAATGAGFLSFLRDSGYKVRKAIAKSLDVPAPPAEEK